MHARQAQDVTSAESIPFNRFSKEVQGVRYRSFIFYLFLYNTVACPNSLVFIILHQSVSKTFDCFYYKNNQKMNMHTVHFQNIETTTSANKNIYQIGTCQKRHQFGDHTVLPHEISKSAKRNLSLLRRTLAARQNGNTGGLTFSARTK